MNTFILGQSYTGKSPLAKEVARLTGAQHIMASEWVREEYSVPHGTREDFIAGITAYSLQRLQEEPNVCVDYIHAHYDLTRSSVIEGVRNPQNFVHLFDYRHDHVIELIHVGNPYPKTTFEEGLSVIGSYLDWLSKCGLFDPTRRNRYEFNCLYRAEKKNPSENSLDEVITQVREVYDGSCRN